MPDSSSPKISGSEWLVASVVWETDGLTAAEIAAALGSGVQWKLKTVNTFLSRVVGKGVLEVAREGRAHRYHARILRDQCVRAESESFLDRVFGGAVAPLLAHFCEAEELTDSEIVELRRILHRKAARSPQARTRPPFKRP